jgi:hypothetical protein
LGTALALLGVASFGGCFVSFDGYELADAGGANGETSGAGGALGSAGNESTLGGGGAIGTSGSSAIGGTSNAGASSGGAAGRAGSNSGGSSGSSGNGSAGSNSNGGTSNGGAAGTNAGSGGSGVIGGTGGTSSAGSSSGGTSSAGASGSAGTGGNPPSCPVPLHGAILVEIPKPGGGIFCIDRTEATNQDYAAFLASNPSTATQSAVCSGNTTFVPASDSVDCTQYDPTNKPKVPVACVDWCDAAAYCAWAGKRLCGKIGGGANSPAAFADATQSEWYAACSHGGTLDFPYGDTYDSTACIGADVGVTRPTAVPTQSCQGGYDGVFDLSGNVSEWENSCAANTGMSDACLYRGGAYDDLDNGTTPTLFCNSGSATTPKSATHARSTREPDIGFRCCADP